MSLKQTGPWFKLQNRYDNAGIQLHLLGQKPLLHFAEAALQHLQVEMLEVKPKIKALHPTTVRIKRSQKKNNPEAAWNDTGWLAKNGFARPKVYRTAGEISGVSVSPANRRHPDAKVSVRTLMMGLEYGRSYKVEEIKKDRTKKKGAKDGVYRVTYNQPPRPFLAPFMRRLKHNGFNLLRNFNRDYGEKIRIGFHQ